MSVEADQIIIPENSPSVKDIAERAYALCTVVQYAIACPRPGSEEYQKYASIYARGDREYVLAAANRFQEEFWQPFVKSGGYDFLSDREKKFAESNFVEMPEEVYNFGIWRLESFKNLLWSLGLTTHLGAFDDLTGIDFAKGIDPEKILAISNSAELVSSKALLFEREKAELFHWRARVERYRYSSPEHLQKILNGNESFDDLIENSAKKAKEKGLIEQILDNDFPLYKKAYKALSNKELLIVNSIIHERHFSLNWLCGYSTDNDWESTPTPTGLES